MNKVTTINLAGTAYQLEEAGYEKLQAYLHDATKKLDSDPDKTEIIQDLERAIAEKCDTYLTASKNVVATSEVEQIIADMGPVHTSEHEEGAESDAGAKTTSADSTKRLYRVREGSLFLGVCAGLAAYFDIDVVLVRVIFAVLALLTHGAMLAIYFIMAFIIPRANTPEKRAAAYGVPFSTQEFISRAQNLSDDMRASKREWKRYRKSMKYSVRMQQPNYSLALVGPIMGGLSLLWAFALISLVTTHAILGFALPTGLPLWLAIVLMCFVYAAVISPIRWVLVAHKAYYQNDPKAMNMIQHHGPPGPVGFVIQVLFLWFVGWLLYTYVPTVHDFFNTVWMTIQNSGILNK